MKALRIITIALASVGLATADTITLRPTAAGERPYRVEGEVLDWRGEGVKFSVGRSSSRLYPADRVVDVQTTWPEGVAEAKTAIQRRLWQAAADSLPAAERKEKRPWARRQIAIRRLECLLALGQWKRAGDLLIAIDSQDRTTRAWRLAPLPWFASDAISMPDASSWLARREESARLLGAAWLLFSPRSSQAVGELRSLARSRHAAIATLAETQLWRRDLTRADRRQTDRWARRLQSVPPHLAAGPRHILAQAYRRQKRYDDAALAALEGPLTGAAPHRLAARGLLLASRSLQAAGQDEESRVLLAELTRDYADTPQADSLQARPAKP
ncbi:MAG: hypothetical protein AAGJ46_07115 [Planctomycetota bacterium]